MRNGDATGCAHDYGCDKLDWGSEDGSCVKVYGRYDYYCGSSARRFYLPIAQRIWHGFTRPILVLIGKAQKTDRLDKFNTASGRKCAKGSGYG